MLCASNAGAHGVTSSNMQVIDLKGELANSKAGQAAIKQAVDTAAKEAAASVAREKSLKVMHPCFNNLKKALPEQTEC